jgi:TonB family protein
MKIAAISSEWVGRVVDERYTLMEWLGGSADSGVFLTEFKWGHPQKAAIKLIAVDDAEAAARLGGWEQAMKLPHLCLARLHSMGLCEIDGGMYAYLVTEYASERLAEILPMRALTADETREMLGPVLDALSFLHGKGYVHGAVKPSNILVIDDQVKLSAENIMAAGTRARSDAVLSVYDRPEIATRPLTPAADLWSLGVTLVETLTQQQPVWERTANQEPVVPSELPAPFAEIVRECLRLDPARRCTVAEVQALLEGRVVERPEPMMPTPSAAAPERNAPVKFPTRALVVGLVAVLVIVVALLVRGHGSQATPETTTQQTSAESGGPQHVAGEAARPSADAPAAKAAVPKQAETAMPTPPSPVPTAPAASAAGSSSNGAVVQRVMPEVLPSAMASIRGTVPVSVRVEVGADGNVSNATFVSAGPSRYFSRVTMEAARKWKFAPAGAGSRVWLLRFQFKQSGAEVTATEETQ